ncbi:MAG: hypothetical protein BYD32DRAFT_487292 [Podila humilis]|nr:MAG: hypothetical protein BYD32DRAFT_487292 [Podila humilis]
MPFTSDRKNLIREIEMTILLADNDDDEETKFEHLTSDESKSTFRTTRQGVSAPVGLLQGHSVFQNKSTCNQLDPAWQIAVTLARFGGGGNGSSIMSKQVLTGLATGTINKYTERVITALMSVKHEWIQWPDKLRRQEISDVLSLEGFPGCIGFVDGTTIPLAQKPALNGETYFDRKKR